MKKFRNNTAGINKLIKQYIDTTKEITVFKQKHMTNNSIFTIHPYLYNGTTWVFDEPRVGLDKEAFVAGADLLCDRMCEKSGHSPEEGFTAIFSAIPFPGHKVVLEQVETVDEGRGGTIFYCPVLEHPVWLCAAMLLFFPTPPPFIYIDFK